MYVLFVCMSVRLQVSFIPLRFRYLGRRFSLRSVDLLRKRRYATHSMIFAEKTRNDFSRALLTAKNNIHVVLDKTAKIWRRENIPLYGIPMGYTAAC